MDSSSDFTVANLFYDGQFWVMVVARSQNGNIFTAKHTFGAEPTGPELLSFMLDGYDALTFMRVPSMPVLREKGETKHGSERAASALDRFKDAQNAYLEQKKQERPPKTQEAYEARRLKRKEKRKH